MPTTEQPTNIFSLLGVSNNPTHTRAVNDFYSTNPEAVKAILKELIFSKEILEPCCGNGAISKVLTDNNHVVTNLDIEDYGYHENFTKCDFLSYNPSTPFNGDIITNPPYSLAYEFVEHSLDIVRKGAYVCMLLRIQFLEGKKRQKLFKVMPPKYVYVFSSRMRCFKDGDTNVKNSSALCLCWFVWEKGFCGEPIVRWL